MQNLTDSELLALHTETKTQISRYSILQESLKVGQNSVYGALGSVYMRYFSVPLAEAVTMSGRLVINWVEKELNKFLNKACGTTDVDFIIGVDTDSVLLNLELLVQKRFGDTLPETSKIISFMDLFCQQKLQPILDDIFNDMADYTNAAQKVLYMKRELLADSGIWTGKKKKYALNIWDKEGVRYTVPKLKITGLEPIKSSTPAPCRVNLKESIRIILQGKESEIRDLYERFRKEYFLLPVEAIAKSTGIEGMDTYACVGTNFVSKTPGHVKSALLYNHLLKVHKLQKKYRSIKDGDKIKLVHLKPQNPTGCDTIGFLDFLPKEFDLHEYIDYETQFDKTFISPVQEILDIKGWTLEEVFSLEDFFS